MTTLLDQDMTYAYCPIVKMEKTAEGLMVWGQAAGTGLDLDLQRFDADYLKRAVPDWFKWGNVREQHSQIAAGVGKELEVSPDGQSYMLKALVVDPVTIKKVETGVLKGFSPGIKRGKVVKSATAPNGLIVDGEMVEISLVDRPSDPINKISICKAAGSGTLLPVDGDGQGLDIIKWLTPDQFKSAQATASDILEGTFDEASAEETARALAEMADLLIAEAMMLKSADLTQPYDISGLVMATNALEMFLDDSEAETWEVMKSLDPDLTKRYFSTEEREDKGTVPAAPESANIDDAKEDLVKAAVAEVSKAWSAKFDALTEELARVKATPIPGGPVVIPPRTTPELTKSTRADQMLAVSQKPGLDPALASLYVQAAKGAQTS